MADTHPNPGGSAGGGGGAPSHGPSSYRRLINVTDLWVTIIILATVAVLWYHSTLWDEVSAFITGAVEPTLFPRIWLATIAILALFLPFEQYLQGERGKDLDKDRSKPVKAITYLTMLVMVPISASMEWLGSVPVVVLICVVLPLIWGERRFYILIPYVILFPPIIYFLFKVAFKVNFEPGVIGLGIK